MLLLRTERQIKQLEILPFHSW